MAKAKTVETNPYRSVQTVWTARLARVKRPVPVLALIAGLVLPISVASASASASAPTATLRASTRQLPLSGGALSVTAVVHGAQSCLFFSAPQVRGIDGKVRCANGKVVRHGTAPRTSRRRPIQFELVVTGTNGLIQKEITVHEGKAPTVNPNRTIFQQSGTGEATTSSFTVVPNALFWIVNWSYNCGPIGNFSYFVYTGTGPDVNDIGSTDLNRSGSGYDSFSDTGTFYFQIPTACSWTMSVTETLNIPGYTDPRSTLIVKPLRSATVVDQAGAPITVSATVKHAAWCTFISVPTVPGIDGKVRCANGTVTRQGQVPASIDPRTIQFELVAMNATSLQTAGIAILQRNPQTLMSQSGSSTDSTTSGQFVIPASDSQWTLTWTYDCTAMPFDSGYMIIDVNGSSADDVEQLLTGAGSQTDTHQDTGAFSLSISATCNWTVSVVG